MPRNKKSLYVFTVYTLIFCSNTFAQKLRFTHIGVEQGLPANEVYNLYQDNRGYVWAFSIYGIAKHNGTKFIPVCRNLPFDKSTVYVVTESAQGDLYFGNSKAQIYHIRNDSGRMVTGIEKTSEQLIKDHEVLFDLKVNTPEDIYFSTYRSSYHFHNGRLKGFTHIDTTIRNVCFKKTRRGFISIHKVITQSKKCLIEIADEQNNILCKAYIEGRGENNGSNWGDRCNIREINNNYYIQVLDKLVRLGKDGKITAQAPLKGVTTMEASPDGHIWMATQTGLYELDSNLTVLAHYLESSMISDILFDDHNGIWVSTLGQGIFYSSSTYHSFYDHIPALAEDISMLKRSGDTLFIGTLNGSLFMKTRQALKKVDLNFDGHSVYDIFSVGEEYLVGNRKDMFRVDNRFTSKKSIRSLRYVGKNLNGSGFIRQDPDTVVFITGSAILKASVKNNFSMTEKIVMPSKGTTIIDRNEREYFIGTLKGVFKFNDSLSSPAELAPLKEVSIARLKKDKKNNIWICTYGHGLYILDSNNRLKVIRDLPSDVINNIVFDENDGTLLCTNKGLYRYAKIDAETSFSWHRILEMEAISCAIFGDEIFVATQQGLISLNKQKLYEAFNPVFHLESVWANDRRLDLADLNFRYNENDLYFNFDVLAYHHEDYVVVYSLKGKGAAKNIIAGNRLHLQNLTPGEYRLSVSILDNANPGLRNSPQEISFYIKPAFWQTSLFLILVIVGALAFTVLLMRYIYQNAKKKEQRKFMIMRELAEHRLTALKAQINPHFISNSLTAIQYLVFDNEIKRANQYIARFSLLIRHALEHSDKVLSTLENELMIIDIVVALEQLRFSNSFIFEKDIAEGIDTTLLFIPPMITQPIIENAIWHGLLPLKVRTPKLTLKIYKSNLNLKISIRDNGVGRQLVKLPQRGKESRGNRLIQSWIDNLNKLLPENSVAINFIDLYDENNDPAGTNVEIILSIEALSNLQNGNR